MTALRPTMFTCNFGSGARLIIAPQSAHAVIGVEYDGRRETIALTPASLRALAARLVEIAEAYEGEGK